jgi:DsbC/DsbD-like thiol-disulfide interchange protein
MALAGGLTHYAPMKWMFAALTAAVTLVPSSRAGCEVGCPKQESVAASTAWSGDAMAPSRLILATPSHGYGGPVWIAIQLDIADGWFVYASATDEAAGPQLGWRGSTNLAPPALRWPPPQTRVVDGRRTQVYEGRVTLPVSIAPLDPGADVAIGLTLTYAVCGEVCRPATAVHRIRLSAAPVEVPGACVRQAAQIADALSRAPP